VPKNRLASQTFIEAARRRQIVDAAIDVIADEGYGQATFERIASRAGISRGLISYHFESRDELMAAVVARAYEDGAAYIAGRLAAAPKHPGDLLHVYLRSNVEYLRDHRRELLALIAVRQAGSQSGLHRSLVGLTQALGPLERILRWGQDTGAFRVFDVHMMAIAIRNVIDGLPHYMSVEPELDVDRYAAEILALFSLATRTSERFEDEQ
jgi:TetR/AcrR family transcriptional regulator, fatty acid metabolism regulator protein